MLNRSTLCNAILMATLLPNISLAAELSPITVETTLPEAQQNNEDVASLLNQSNSETGSSLRLIPGLEASRMGGHGVDPIIRGQSASRLNVLLDGAKIEGGCPNRMDPPTAYVEMSSYDEVTVLKGVKTLTTASGGTGGTILFKRSTPQFTEEKPYQGEINLGTSSNGLTEDMNATLAGGNEQGYILLQGSKKSADNYEDGNGEEIRSSYDSRQAHIDLGWTPNKHHELKLSYERSVIEDALFPGARMDSPESDGDTLRLQYEGKNLGVFNSAINDIKIDVYQSDVDHLMDNYTLRPPGMMQRFNKTAVTTEGAKITLTSLLGHTELDYGVQTEVIEKQAAFSQANGDSVWLMWPDTKTTKNSLFAEATSYFKNDQTVILGLRYDDFSAKADQANTASDAGNIAAQTYNNVYGVTNTNNDNNGLSVLARYERMLNANTQVFAGLSRSYRFPDASELYIVKGPAWTGNPQLDAEKHNQFDIGLSQRFNKTQWSLSAFYDKVDDYVLNYFDGGQRYKNVDAKLYGLEVEANAQLSTALSAGVNTHLTRGSNTTDNRNLANMTPLSGSVYAQYSQNDYNLGARVNFASKQDKVDSNLGELTTAGWSTLDVYGNYALNKTVTLSAGIDNAFDKTYQNSHNRVDLSSGNLYNLNEPGRTVWAKLNAKF